MATYMRWCQRPLHYCQPRPTAGTLLRVRRRQPSAPRRTAGRRRWSYRRPLLLPWFRWSVNNRLSRDDDRLRKKIEFHIPSYQHHKLQRICLNACTSLHHCNITISTIQRWQDERENNEINRLDKLSNTSRCHRPYTSNHWWRWQHDVASRGEDHQNQFPF